MSKNEYKRHTKDTTQQRGDRCECVVRTGLRKVDISLQCIHICVDKKLLLTDYVFECKNLLKCGILAAVTLNFIVVLVFDVHFIVTWSFYEIIIVCGELCDVRFR